MRTTRCCCRFAAPWRRGRVRAHAHHRAAAPGQVGQAARGTTVGQLVPWTRGHYGYQVDPERPRDPAGVQRDDTHAAVVEHLFAAYLEEGATLYSVGKSLERMGVLTPR